MRGIAAAALLLRRLRNETSILLVLFVLVAFTSFLVAAAPRLFNRVSDEAVHYSLTTAPAAERDVWINANGSIPPGAASGVSAVRTYGQEREADFPASVEHLVSDRLVGITSVRLAVQQSIVGVSLRYQDGAADGSRLVSGRWPVDLGMPLRQLLIGQKPDTASPPTVFEAALSTAQADTIGVHVGDRLHVALDHTDPLAPTSVYGITPTDIEVVGIFKPNDANADQWTSSGLLQPTLRYGRAGLENIYVTALIPAETYPSLAAGVLPFRYEWRFQVDPAGVDENQVEALRPDLRQLDLIASLKEDRFMSATSSMVRLTNVSTRSGLLGILDRYEDQRARSASVLSIAALGPLGLAAAAIAMLAILLIRRRRASLVLTRNRGASGTLLLGTQLWEAIVLMGGASIVGLLLAENAIAARDTPLSLILAIGVAGAATLILVAATWPTARRPLIQLERADTPLRRVPVRRLVADGTIIGISVLAIVLLRQRGLTLGQASDTVQFDPLLAAVPLLAGLAAGILAIRLYPLPVRGLGSLAARRRDFVPVVGLRTVARRPASARLPLIVLMLAAAFGAFASVVQTSIDRGQVAASYLEVGADYRLEAIGNAGLPSTLDPTAVPGVQAVASGIVDHTAAMVSEANQRTAIDLNAIDAAAYATVASGTATDPGWPGSFLAAPSPVGVGTDANPIPAIVPTQFPPSPFSLGPGDTFVVTVAKQKLTFRVVERRASIPGVSSVSNFAIVPLNWFRATGPGASLEPTVMWLRGSDDAAAPLVTMAAAASGKVRLVSRPDAYGALHDSPLGSAVADGFGAALDVAVLYLAITLVCAVFISTAGGTRDLAYLRVLGVSARQALGLTSVENAPPVLLALIPGVLLGIGVAVAIEPGLGLADFVGASGVPLFVDWPTLGLVVVALAAVVIVAIGAGTWLARRERLVSTLRIEDS